MDFIAACAAALEKWETIAALGLTAEDLEPAGLSQCELCRYFDQDDRPLLTGCRQCNEKVRWTASGHICTHKTAPYYWWLHAKDAAERISHADKIVNLFRDCLAREGAEGAL